ncbi:unnamed protein product, partial [Rotaria magnacalcarata]
MRSTSCFAVLSSSSNGHEINTNIDKSYSESNIISNSKKSTARTDILQSVPIDVLEKIDEVILDV